jgi:hypothetical protein
MTTTRSGDGDGDNDSKRLISTAGFVREPHPGEHAGTFGPLDAQWRLRGMATATDLQRRGIGGRVLEFGVCEIAR